MDFALISTFLDLASSGSFSRTAERMHLTQSAVSARIRSLEQALNCRLFERDHNGAHLTEAGQRFIAYATSINRLWLQGRQDAAMGTDVVSQIGAGIHVCVWKRVALPWMNAMRKHMPELRLRVEIDYSEVLSQFTAEGTLDVSLIYTPRALPGLKVERLFEDLLVLVADRPETLGDHLRHGYIYIDWSYGYRQRHAELLPIFSSPRTIIGNPEAAMDYLLERGGSAYFPLSDVDDKIASRQLFRVQDAPVIRRPCYATYPDKSVKEEILLPALAILRNVTTTLGYIAPGPDANRQHSFASR
jgi:DNA-binding transcriptional LysR family regulator